MKYAPPHLLRSLHTPPVRRNSGVTLIVVLLILVVVSILGVSGIQISMMGERGTPASATAREHLINSGKLSAQQTDMFNFVDKSLLIKIICRIPATVYPWTARSADLGAGMTVL